MPKSKKAPEAIENVLRAFQESMEVYGLAPNTVRVYMSRVRRFFVIMQTDLSAPDLQDKLDEYVNKHATSAFTYAWSCFVQWASDQGIDTPASRSRYIDFVPLNVRLALVELRGCFARRNGGLPARVIAATVWNLIRVDQGKVVFFDPHSALGANWEADYAAIGHLKTIYAYAYQGIPQADRHPQHPFFPASAGSTQHLHARQIEGLMRNTVKEKEKLSALNPEAQRAIGRPVLDVLSADLSHMTGPTFVQRAETPPWGSWGEK